MSSRAWGRAHLAIGGVTVLVFAGTGLLMRWHQPPLEALDPGLRMLFRSRHIYILFAGLLNLAVGLWPLAPAAGWRRLAAVAGRWLVVLAPLLLVAAFFVETRALRAPTPLSNLGVEAAFAGTLLSLLARLPRRGAAGG